MKLNKQILSLLLAAVMVLTFAPTAILAGAKTPKTKTVTVRAVEDHFTSNSHDEEWSFTYSDDYFTKSGYTFRQDLACMTLGLAMASFTSRDAINEGDHSKENQNFIALMKHELRSMLCLGVNETFERPMEGGLFRICDLIFFFGRCLFHHDRLFGFFFVRKSSPG